MKKSYLIVVSCSIHQGKKKNIAVHSCGFAQKFIFLLLQGVHFSEIYSAVKKIKDLNSKALYLWKINIQFHCYYQQYQLKKKKTYVEKKEFTDLEFIGKSNFLFTLPFYNGISIKHHVTITIFSTLQCV